MVSGFIFAEASSFVGRTEDLKRVRRESESARVVTIAGPAGVGKTRLALRFAQHARQSVWFCDMRDARVPSEMAAVVLRAFSGGVVHEGSDSALQHALLQALDARPGALVVLDNVEHLLPAAAPLIRRWIGSSVSQGVRFLVTSRVALGIAGERVVSIGGVLPRDAVDLFVERVRSRAPEFSPSDVELENIDEIVRRLSHVPLAIELAAADTSDDAAALLARLQTSRPPDPSAASHRAFTLLDPNERELLRRCSVFRGSFSLAAVERIAESVRDARVVVVGLASKNILCITRYQPMRFSMCEGVRSLAAASLVDAAEIDRVHAELLCDRARTITEGRPPADAPDDREDLRAAMRYGAQHHRSDIVFFTALAIETLALGGGLDETELAELDEALRHGAARDLSLLCRALLARSSSLHALGRLVESRRDAETALLLALETSDARRTGEARRAAARSAFQLGDLEPARAHLACALDIERERGDAIATATVHQQIGSLHNTLGELSLARTSFERSLQLTHGAGDASGEALAFLGLAWGYVEEGQRDVAREHYARALVILRGLGMRRSELIAIGYLGLLEFADGNLERAEEQLRLAALGSRKGGDLRACGIFEGIRGGVLASLDRIAASRIAFDLADELLARNPFYQGAIRIHRGHLDLAEARAAWGDGADAHVAEAAAHVAEARWRIEEARTLARRSDDARLAIAILEESIARARDHFPKAIPSG